MIRRAWAALLVDMADHPGWYSILGYGIGTVIVSFVREQARVRAMLGALERDFTERREDIEDAMLPHVMAEYDAETTITDDDISDITHGAIR